MRLLAAFLALALDDPAAPSPAARVRGDIIVTAARGPEQQDEASGAVSVLRRGEIERLPAQTLGELLAFVPGLFSFFRGAEAGTSPMLTARGFFGGGEAEYVQLRIDGVPVGDPESGLADWRGISTASIERVELLRGTASSLYGDTSLAGVVQVFTRRDPGLAAELSGGSFGAAAADATMSFVLGKFVLRSAARAARTDGFRAHAAGDREGGDVLLSTQLGPGILDMAVALDRNDREDPGALPLADAERGLSGSDALFRFDRETTTRRRATVSWGKEGAWHAALYGSSRGTSRLRTLLIAPGLGDRALREVSSSSLGATLDAEQVFKFGGLSGRVRAGAELSRERLDNRYRPVGEDGEGGDVIASGGGRRERVGVLGSVELNRAETFGIVAGVRWDVISDSFGALGQRDAAISPRLTTRALVGSVGGLALSVFVEGSSAFKAPTLDQLFDPRPFRGPAGTFTISSPTLTPQRARTFQGGLAGRNDRLELQILGYRTAVDDEIDFDPATFRYRNIGRSLHVGLEASGRWRPAGSISPFASYAWTNASPRDGSDAGRQLKNVPRHLLALGVTVSLPAGLEADAVLHRMAGRFADDSNRVAMKNARWVDLRLSRRFARWRAFLDLLNVTRTRYSEVGFVLSDFRGNAVAYGYPATAFQARVGVAWTPETAR